MPSRTLPIGSWRTRTRRCPGLEWYAHLWCHLLADTKDIHAIVFKKSRPTTSGWVHVGHRFFYAVPMYLGRVYPKQSMWKQFTESGQLKIFFPRNSDLPETILCHVHWAAPSSWLAPFLMVYNIYKTVKAGKLVADGGGSACPSVK